MKTSHILLIGFTTLSLNACQTLNGLKQDLSSARSAVGSKVSSLKTKEEKAEDIKNEVEEKVSVIVNDNICPPLNIDPQLSHTSEFYDPEKPSKGTEVSSLNLTDTASECSIEDGYKEVKIQLSFTGALGPKAKRKENDRPFFAYPYFVTVTDKDGEELAKELFAASVTYEKNQEKIALVETIRQKLPLNDDGTDPGYRIKIGFQLTEDQLFYNASR